MAICIVFTGCIGYTIRTKAADNESTINITGWQQIGEYSFLPTDCHIGELDVVYYYDENNVRIGKSVGGILTTYEYMEYTDDCNITRYKLVSENRNGKIINYLYDVNEMIGFTYEDKNYRYLYDSYGNIYGISQNGETVGTYIYDDNYISYTISDSSDNGIMDINPIRYNGFYLDSETGYYYADGKYNDLKNMVVVNKMVDANINYSRAKSSTLPVQVLSDIDYYFDYQLTYGGVSIPYTTIWYNNVSTIDALARTIYGEFSATAELSDYENDNTKLYQQRKGVAWVIANRCNSALFPNMPYDVIVQANQFKALTGTDSVTWNARNPYVNYAAWTQASALAVYLYCAYNKSYTGVSANDILINRMSKPTGITTQKYFVSHATWSKGYNVSDGTFAFSGGTPRLVKDVASNVGNIAIQLSRNVFFDFQ